MILPRYERFCLWGLTDGHDSFRHVHRHYFTTARRLGKEVAWLEDAPKSRDLLQEGDLVFAVDIASEHLGHPVEGVDYVLHNFDSTADIWDGLPEERALRLQVYTNACERYGLEWAPGRRYDRAGRILFQPWGTDLLAEDFKPPIFNPHSIEVPFVGSIWDSDGQGNVSAITELKKVVNDRRLTFRHYQHVSDGKNAHVVRNARIAPAFTGAWQIEQDYLPCRVFKNVSYGALALTQVPFFRRLFGDAWTCFGSVGQIVTDALDMDEQTYLDLVAAQQDVVRNYTYRESLQSIERALEEGR